MNSRKLAGSKTLVIARGNLSSEAVLPKNFRSSDNGLSATDYSFAPLPCKIRKE